MFFHIVIIIRLLQAGFGFTVFVLDFLSSFLSAARRCTHLPHTTRISADPSGLFPFFFAPRRAVPFRQHWRQDPDAARLLLGVQRRLGCRHARVGQDGRPLAGIGCATHTHSYARCLAERLDSHNSFPSNYSFVSNHAEVPNERPGNYSMCKSTFS